MKPGPWEGGGPFSDGGRAELNGELYFSSEGPYNTGDELFAWDGK